MQELEFSEKRSGKDRRKQPTSPFTLESFLWGNRRLVRRKEDRSIYYYVDQYGMGVILIVLLTMLLSIADAFITVRLLGLGAQELNPLMDFVLQYGPLPFLMTKYVLTASGLTWLLIHKDYPLFGGRIRGRILLLGSFCLYVMLFCYEVILISS